MLGNFPNCWKVWVLQALGVLGVLEALGKVETLGPISTRAKNAPVRVGY